MTDAASPLEKLKTDVICPDCGKGNLIANIANDGILVRETCTACKFSNEVLAHKEKLEAASKSS